MRTVTQRLLCVAAMLLAIAPASRAGAQAGPHLVLVKMVDKPNAHFAFEPATVVAQPGDTVRFLQQSAAPHDVHVEKTPKGAKLGTASSGPYLFGQGKTYDLIIDSRFVNGTYEFECDPHESLGMRGTLTVGPPTN